MSAEAIERRRRQNRASQMAARERNRKLIEALREDVSQCAEYNQELCLQMQDVLEKAEELWKAMEGVLASRPPRAIQQWRDRGGSQSAGEDVKD